MFNWFAYFFFVFYSIVGFVGAILRLLLSLLLGTLLLFRLDQNIMMAGFQFADWGRTTICIYTMSHIYTITDHNIFPSLSRVL